MAADKVGAANNAQAIMAGLFRQARTGLGCHIQANMLDANLAFVWPDTMMHCSLMDDDAEQHPNLLQTYRLFAGTDGWVSMALGNDAQWEAACRALDREDQLEDERFSTPTLRSANIEAWYEVQDEMTAPFTVEELVARLVAADVPVAPALLPEDVYDDPHIRANDMVKESVHPTAGRYRHPQPRANVMGEDLDLAPAPLWGEHSEAILQELGYAGEEAGKLIASGAVRQASG
jgi:crotonobetainyl-CoA:carnitine CoA-transferase CaiB-like acyl-CoA transferase